jgi:hypothetical protein
MARSDSNAILKKARGAIGKQIVIKQYGKKTVITAYPDMSNVNAKLFGIGYYFLSKG